MEITSVEIENFRSIKKIEFPFQDYGKGKNKNKTAILIGINESGKSAILEGIKLLNQGTEIIDYYETCHKDSQEDNSYIDIYANLKISKYEEDRLISYYSEQSGWDKEDFNNITITKIRKNVYKNSESSGFYFEITLKGSFPYFKYISYEKKKTVNGKVLTENLIGSLKKVNSVSEEINRENAKKFLIENQEILTNEELEKQFKLKVEPLLNIFFPKIILWKPIDEYLINDPIDISEFISDPKSNIPLRNIFKIYGKKSDDEIKKTVELGLKNQQKTDELNDKLSDCITKYVNSIWKEHKIKFKISMNQSECQVHVEDKDKKFSYYSMEQRSDGFKQFISLILSISIDNKTNHLDNNVILIDEPEVHLHPSGIKYLRDELLKIGKNNNVIISTHSSFLVDTTTPERHWIIKKEKAITKLEQLNDSTSLKDEKVLKSAFGLSIFKELLPSNIIVVEGEEDKRIFQHVLKLLESKIQFKIKTAKGASKAVTLASLLDEQEVPAYFIFDDDFDGRKYAKQIRTGFNGYFKDKTFTLFDLTKKVPEKGTLEDLLPFEFVSKILNEESKEQLSLDIKKPILRQAKDQSKVLKIKEKIESVKKKICNNFIEEFNSIKKLEKAPILLELVKKIDEILI